MKSYFVNTSDKQSINRGFQAVSAGTLITPRNSGDSPPAPPEPLAFEVSALSSVGYTATVTFGKPYLFKWSGTVFPLLEVDGIYYNLGGTWYEVGAPYAGRLWIDNDPVATQPRSATGYEQIVLATDTDIKFWFYDENYADNTGSFSCTLEEIAGWIEDIDFTASDAGFSAYSLGATYVAGEGWKTVAGAGGQVAFIQKTLTACNILRVEAYYTWDSPPAGTNGAVEYGTVVHLFGDPSPIIVNKNGGNNATAIRFIIGNGGGGAIATISRIVLYGSGTSPF